MPINHMRYSVLIVETEEVLECDSLQVLYNAIRRRFRYARAYENNERITAKFYKDLDWSKHGFHPHPFYIMVNYEY